MYVEDKDDLAVVEDDAIRGRFAKAVGRYLRGVRSEDLRVDYAGMR